MYTEEEQREDRRCIADRYDMTVGKKGLVIGIGLVLTCEFVWVMVGSGFILRSLLLAAERWSFIQDG